MSKKLLEESTIRQFMKLAQLEPLAGDFLEEKRGGKKRPVKRPMREEEMEEGIRDDGTTPLPPPAALGKKKTMDATEKADKEARAKLEKKPGKVDEEVSLDEGDYGSHKDDPMLEEDTLEEELSALLEDELSEMGMYEEEEDEGMEMEVEEGDKEAEINITPDQARAIIAVADMLKDIMPDLEAPEMEDEEEMEMEPEMEPTVDMEGAIEGEGDVAAAAAGGEEIAARPARESVQPRKLAKVLNSKKIALVINTGGGNSEHRLNDAIALRRATLKNKVPYCTNMSTAQACLEAIKSLKTKKLEVTSLQDI